MSFYDIIKQYDWNEVTRAIASTTPVMAEQALAAKVKTAEHFMALISPAAAPYLKAMATQSIATTRRRFGNTMQLYVPLYLSNFCENGCVYCGFASQNHIHRKVLTNEEIVEEGRAIQKLGFQHLLLVCGEAPKKAGTEYLANAIRLLKPLFAQISIEVQPLDQADYEILIAEGLHAVYVYQETYREETYKHYHPRGRKSNYRYRLETPDRMGAAGIHKIGLGNLIGLEDWRTEAFFTALHLQYLEKKYWKSRFSLSFPRLRPCAGEGFQPNHIMHDRDLVQLIVAYRLLDEQVELSLSTRESEAFRNQLIPLGITAVSAGSSTEPGGYAHHNHELEQFTINDSRTPQQMAQYLTSKGFDPVWKDWDVAINSIV